MPRPTAAQLALGSATVVLSTLAMLLLSGATSALGAAVAAVAGLGLGLLVAVTVPARQRAVPRTVPQQTVVASPVSAPAETERVSALRH
ncbi:hypothetical protein DSC45_07155 [Streptomyces sp. YIM 130001]|uniref:hypothetical protein n=1 Tax=Streptomyces sp. YIM 130001 TaxID=2259644 RepID=UPI000E6516CB|nr:hypothetical protein [Streptomyces sp. YIM 130001]RII19772.1 hypothetical protein DSC45_07155 [Streptomyces sp. YIM 130001]